MTTAALHADVDATIALWRSDHITARAAWRSLGNPGGRGRGPAWHTIRTFMLGWLARAEARSLQRVG